MLLTFKIDRKKIRHFSRHLIVRKVRVSRGNRTTAIVPPVLRTPSGPRQAPRGNGPYRPNENERLAAG